MCVSVKPCFLIFFLVIRFLHVCSLANMSIFHSVCHFKDAFWSRAVALCWNDCTECAQDTTFEPQHNMNTNIPSNSKSKIKEKHSFQRLLT